MNKLLETAKKESDLQDTVFEINRDVVELAVEVLNGRISYRGMMKALGFKNVGSVTSKIPTILKYGMKEGIIKIEMC